MPKEFGFWRENQARCATCNSKFGLFKRRHHCRSCGMVVCDECSKGREYMDYNLKYMPDSKKQKDPYNLDMLGVNPVRLCDYCVKVAKMGGWVSPEKYLTESSLKKYYIGMDPSFLYFKPSLYNDDDYIKHRYKLHIIIPKNPNNLSIHFCKEAYIDATKKIARLLVFLGFNDFKIDRCIGKGLGGDRAFTVYKPDLVSNFREKIVYIDNEVKSMFDKDSLFADGNIENICIHGEVRRVPGCLCITYRRDMNDDGSYFRGKFQEEWLRRKSNYFREDVL